MAHTPQRGARPPQVRGDGLSFNTRRLLAIGVAGALMLALVAGWAMVTMLRQLRSVEQSQAAIQNELAEVKKLLERQPEASAPRAAAPANPVIDIAGAAVKGRPGAPLTLVEFSDYQ